MRGGRAVGGGDPAHELGVEAGRLRGGQLAGEHDAGLGRAGRLLAGDGGDDAAPDVEHVGGALAQERLVEPAVERGHLLGRVVPRALGRGAGRDGLVGGLEQRLVVEQRQVGVEDRRLGLAGAPGDGLAVARDRPRAAAIASSRRSRSRSGAVGRAVGRRAGRRAEVARGTDGDAGARPGTPVSTSPARGAWTAAAAGLGRRAPAGGGAPSGAIPSPKPSSASARSASSASEACGPDALTTSVSPRRAPSATTLVRLVARTGGPPPALATRTSAS